MKSMGVARFKERCLQLLDQLEPDGLVITKHGRPVAKLIPYERLSASLIGSLRDEIEVHGDILSTDSEWDADAQP